MLEFRKQKTIFRTRDANSAINMKNLFFSLFILLLFQGYSQKIRIKVLNEKDTTVHLIRYYGEKHQIQL